MVVGIRQKFTFGVYFEHETKFSKHVIHLTWSLFKYFTLFDAKS